MTNSEKIHSLIINDELTDLFYPAPRLNMNEAEYRLHKVMQDLHLDVEDFIEMNDYCREIVRALDGNWSVLCEYGFGSYVYRHPDVHMKSLVGSMFFKKNIKGRRMAISDRSHGRLGKLLSNTEMVLRLEAITKYLDNYFDLQTKVTRHTTTEGYTTLGIELEMDAWDQTALFRCLFGPDSAFSKS